MLPARPKIVLLAPKQMLPGTSNTLTVRLDSPRPTPIDFVDLFLSGNHVVHGGETTFLRLGARLREKGRLEEGTTELDCRIDLPADVPPSYEGAYVRLRYEARVHVSVPYWPDARRTFLLTARPAPRAPEGDGTLLFASAAGGAPVSGPYAEVSLATRTVAAGDTLQGAVALYNTASSQYERVTITLRQRERMHGFTDHVGASWAIDLAVPRFDEGRPVAFALRVPEMAPAFTFRRAQVTHELALTVRAHRRDVITMPIGIDLLPDPSVDLARGKIAPALGETRVRAIWERVAERTGFRLEDDRLERRVGDRTLVVRRELWSGSPRLLAELRYPSLGLGLRSTPRPFFQLLLPQEAETGVAQIDSGQVFQSRSRSQAEELLVRLGPALVPLLAGKATLHQVEDTRIAIAIEDSGTTEGAVLRMIEVANGLASGAAPVLDVIHLPPPLEGLSEAWRAMAQRLGTSIEMGSGTLEGEEGGARIELRLLFDAEGKATAFRMRRMEPAALEVAAPVHTSGLEGLAAMRQDVRNAAAPILARKVSLSLSSTEVSITDPHVPGEDPVGRIEESFTDLARLCGALRPTRGPFR